VTETVPVPSEEAETGTVAWLADYVYGTISTLIVVASVSFERHPEALTTSGLIVTGAVSIWLAHTLSRLVTKPAWRHLELTRRDIGKEMRGSWSILSAAVPSLFLFLLAGLRVFTVHEAFVLTNVVGVAALAVVGIGTVGGRDRPIWRRILYIVALVAVGLVIVALEALVHTF
jgi:hypothetical protein